MSARVSIVVAVAENGVIGRAGGLPWRLPDDLKRFKELTMGKPVIMGRHTWESLGRPLPGRRNLVISRNPGYTAPGAEVYASLASALASVGDAPDVYAIGGARVYAEALPLAARVYWTDVHASVEGDVTFPPWDRSGWIEVAAIRHPIDARHPVAFTFRTFERAR